MAERQFEKIAINTFANIVSFFIPRSPKRVTCGGWSGTRFCDNSKAMYLFLCENKETLGLGRVTWFTRDKVLLSQLRRDGYDAELIGTLPAFRKCARAKYQFVDVCGGDTERFFSQKAVRVNLWHGMPFKRFGYLCDFASGDIAGAVKANMSHRELGNWNYFYSLTMSENIGKINMQAFGINEKHCVKGPYPRIAYLKGEIGHYLLDSEKQTATKLERLRKSGKRVVAYLPTFRDSKEINAVTVKTVDTLLRWAQENNCCILTKMHAASSERLCGEHELLVNIPSEGDVYNFLGEADVLISDYSSVPFDFMPLGRPLIYYCFDYEYYKNSDRGFMMDFEKNTPGDVVFDESALLESVKNAVDSAEEYISRHSKKMQAVLDFITCDETKELSAAQVQDFWQRIARKKKTEKLERI